MPKRKPNYKAMSVEELEREGYRLDEEATAIRGRKLEVQKELGQKVQIEQARRMTEQLTDDQRQALAQELKVAGAEAKGANT